MMTLTLIAYSLFVQLPLVAACGLMWLAMMWRDLWCDASEATQEAEAITRDFIFGERH
jgi:hypothetical protein